MPLYVYEARDSKKSCAKCRGGFEISQSLKDDKLTVCPDCGATDQTGKFCEYCGAKVN